MADTDNAGMDITPWVPVIAPLASVGAATIAAIPPYRQYRLKQEETLRLIQATRADVDVKLLNTFVTLMARAHARGDSVVVDAAVQAALAAGSQLAPTSLEGLKDLLDHAVVTYPVGFSEQEAAIAAVSELGTRYDILHAPALAGLQHLATWHRTSLVLSAALERLWGGPPVAT